MALCADMDAHLVAKNVPGVLAVADNPDALRSLLGRKLNESVIAQCRTWGGFFAAESQDREWLAHAQTCLDGIRHYTTMLVSMYWI